MYKVIEYSSNKVATQWESTVSDTHSVVLAIKSKGHTVCRVDAKKPVVTIEYVAAGSNKHYVTELVPTP